MRPRTEENVEKIYKLAYRNFRAGIVAFALAPTTLVVIGLFTTWKLIVVAAVVAFPLLVYSIFWGVATYGLNEELGELRKK